MTNHEKFSPLAKEVIIGALESEISTLETEIGFWKMVNKYTDPNSPLYQLQQNLHDLAIEKKANAKAKQNKLVEVYNADQERIRQGLKNNTNK